VIPREEHLLARRREARHVDGDHRLHFHADDQARDTNVEGGWRPMCSCGFRDVDGPQQHCVEQTGLREQHAGGYRAYEADAELVPRGERRIERDVEAGEHDLAHVGREVAQTDHDLAHATCRPQGKRRIKKAQNPKHKVGPKKAYSALW